MKRIVEALRVVCAFVCGARRNDNASDECRQCVESCTKAMIELVVTLRKSVREARNVCTVTIADISVARAQITRESKRSDG